MKDSIMKEPFESMIKAHTEALKHPHDLIEDGKKLPKAIAEIARLKQEVIELKEKLENLKK